MLSMRRRPGFGIEMLRSPTWCESDSGRRNGVCGGRIAQWGGQAA